MHGVWVGEICHIRAKSPGGPRYDSPQTDEQRDGFHNVILLCSTHHKLIDDPSQLSKFTVEVLTQYKQQHEAHAHNTTLSESVLERVIKKVLVENSPKLPRRSARPIVQSLMTCADNNTKLDFYDFRVTLRNDGEEPIKEWRIAIKIPLEFASPNRSSSIAYVEDRDGAAWYRATERGHPGLVIYPGDTSHFILMVDYQVHIDQYVQVTRDEVIEVAVYPGDNVEKYKIADFLNMDRIRALWADPSRRPEALRHRDA
jgi:HNH endonuclease